MPSSAIMISTILLLVTFLVAVMIFGIHRIEEGDVGVYSRGGKVLDGLSPPGYHVMIPYYHGLERMSAVVQTLNVRDIACGTSSGVLIKFDKIEVVYRLKRYRIVDTVRNYSSTYAKTWIEDPIHHEVNQICSRNDLNEIFIEKFGELDEMLKEAISATTQQWSPGIEIVAVRVTKPSIPKSIQREYEKIERARSKLLVLEKQRKVVLKSAEIKANKLLATERKALEVSKIEVARRIEVARSQAEIQTIQDEVHLDRMKARTDATFKAKMKLHESNQRKLVPDYLALLRVKAQLRDCKMYFGPRVPRIIIENQEVLPLTTSK